MFIVVLIDLVQPDFVQRGDSFHFISNSSVKNNPDVTEARKTPYADMRGKNLEGNQIQKVTRHLWGDFI